LCSPFGTKSVLVPHMSLGFRSSKVIEYDLAGRSRLRLPGSAFDFKQDRTEWDGRDIPLFIVPDSPSARHSAVVGCRFEHDPARGLFVPNSPEPVIRRIEGGGQKRGLGP